MSFIEVCAAVIISRDRILLTSRPPGTHMAGFWEFPGGKPKPGENSAICLKRELREELDVDIQVYDTMFFHCHEYPEKKVNIRFVRCSLARDAWPAPQEGQEFVWAPRERIREMKILPADMGMANFLF